MAIDAVFQRAQLEQSLYVEGLRGLHLSLYLDRPGARGQPAGILCGRGLVYAELIEVVVVRNVFKAGELLACGGERALDVLAVRSRLRGNAGVDHVPSEVGAQGNGSRGCGPPKEGAAVEVFLVGVS